MYFDILEANYIGEYKIELTFENGKKGIVDLQSYIGKNDIFSKLTEIDYFRNFCIDSGILTWGDGEIDIAPETLYLKVTGEKEIEWDIHE